LQRYSFFGIQQKIIEKNEKLFGIMRLFIDINNCSYRLQPKVWKRQYFKIQNYETGNMEDDCADSDFDSDCTGDDARSDVVYVTKRGEMGIRNGAHFSFLTRVLE